ncbi:MAG: T9SS type A sorting domain-containing protein [Calditrichaeota bacterium]|nr:T9SS type A sorting domain-containing protein [Calditrichota bacterium]
MVLINIVIYISSPACAKIKHIGSPGGVVIKISFSTANPDNIFSLCYNPGSLFYTNINQKHTIIIDDPLNESTIYGVHSFGEYDSVIIIDMQMSGYYKTVDLGKNWTQIGEGNWTRSFASAFAYNPINKQTIFTAQNETQLKRSDNAGDSWRTVKNFGSPIQDMEVAPGDTAIMYLFTEDYLYITEDAGLSWNSVDTSHFYLSDDFVINPFNSGSLYWAGDGCFKKYTDSGKTLDTLFSGEVSCFAVDPNDTLKLYAGAGDAVWALDGGLYKSINGGQSWQKLQINVPGDYYQCYSIAVNPSNSDELYAGINNLGVFKSADGGETWSMTTMAHTSAVYGMEFFKDRPGKLMTSAQFGWGTLLTDDYGQSWRYPAFDTVAYVDRSGPALITMDPGNPDKGMLAGWSYLFITEDGGESWHYTNRLDNAVRLFRNDYKPAIIFGYTYNQENGFYKSTDNGLNWRKLDWGSYFPALLFFTEDSSIIYGWNYSYDDYEHYLYRSTDGGESWEHFNDGLIFSDETGSPYSIKALAVQHDNPDVLYCGQRGGLSKSTDHGQTWTRIDSALYDMFYQVNVSSILLDETDTNKIYVGLEGFGQPGESTYTSGGLLVSTNGGQSWKLLYTGEVTNIKADYSQPRNIYFTTNFGIMMINDSVATGIENKSYSMPEQFSIQQNYPNPFNPQTTIKYSVASPGKVTLKIYDIRGREVAAIVDKEQSSGNYTVIFNGRKLASGVYIYRLVQNGQSMQRKMLLVK